VGLVAGYGIALFNSEGRVSMTLTTMPISAMEAYNIHLVDEVTEAPDRTIHQLSQKLLRLEETTIEDIKRYFSTIWPITEATEEMAISESLRLMTDPRVRENIYNFVKYMRFPWNK
jgi:polyketide biosynthesis enoyl-CoA hydratase PksH